MESKGGVSLSETVSAPMGLASSPASQPGSCHEWAPNRNLRFKPH